MQCVTHTVPLLRSLWSSPHLCPCSGDGGNSIRDEGRFCSLCALRQHVDLCIRERERFVKPCGFVNNLSNISSSFSRYQQEDAHEFLNCLLDSLHSSCLDTHSGDNTSLRDVSCLPSASQHSVPEIESNQAEDPVSTCIAAPHCRPSSSSSDCDINGAERDHIPSSPGATKCNTPQNEGNLATGVVNGHKTIAPCTPKQSSTDKFYDETWEEDEKENYPKQLFNSELGKSACKANNRELAVLNSYLRSMPRSRRIGLEQFMHPGCRPSSVEHRKRKRKLHLDSENSPCRSSSMRQASSNLLPSSVLQQLVAQDDSQLILAIDSNQGGKRK